MYTDEEIEISIAYFRNQAIRARAEARKQDENADFFENKASIMEEELHFSRMPMPTGNDWYRTVPLGKLVQFKTRHGYIWCPECRGSGLKNHRIPKTVICPKCQGKTIFPARKITDDEMKGLSLYEQMIVRSLWQYPKKRDPMNGKLEWMCNL
ncbi:MAG: hypothetical protein M0Q91_16480 [Methanoregula sp.]|jgi:hypothetical protein|nr:hypothetical protein [Methanoregula sp.]